MTLSSIASKLRRRSTPACEIVPAAVRSSVAFLESLESRRMLTATPTLSVGSDPTTLYTATLQYKTVDGARLVLEQDGPLDDNFKAVAAALDSAAPSGSSLWSVTLNNLTADKDYTFRLRADLDGAVAYSTPVTVTTDSILGPIDYALPVPQVTDAVFDEELFDTQNDVTWDVDFTVDLPAGHYVWHQYTPPSDPDHDYWMEVEHHRLDDPYNVYWMTGSFWTNERHPDGSYTGEALIPTVGGTTHRMRLSLVDYYGYPAPAWSEPSEWFTRTASGTLPDPLTLTGSAGPDGKLRLTRSGGDAAKLTEYGAWSIYRVNGGVATYAGGGTPSQTFVDVDPYSNTSRFLAVYAGSAYSNLVDSVPVVPQPPAGLSVTAKLQAGKRDGSAEARLVWNNVPNNEDRFVVQRSLDPNFGTGDAIFNWTAEADETSYVDKTIHVGRTYYYRVKAANEAGSSSFSAPASAKATVAFNAVSLKRKEEAENLFATDGGGSIGVGDTFDFKVTFTDNVISVPDLRWDVYNVDGWDTFEAGGQDERGQIKLTDPDSYRFRFYVDSNQDQTFDSGEVAIEKQFTAITYNTYFLRFARHTDISVTEAEIDNMCKEATDLLSFRNEERDRRAAVRFIRHGQARTFDGSAYLEPDTESRINSLIGSIRNVDVRITRKFWDDSLGNSQVGTSSSIVLKQGVSGNTLAHEILHTLGVAHVRDATALIMAGDWDNDPMRYNLMWPFPETGATDWIDESQRLLFQNSTIYNEARL